MRIVEFTVENFRGFAHKRPPFKVSREFMAIAGINGRGKTSLLDGLALLLSRLFRALNFSLGNQRTIWPNDVYGSSEKEPARLTMKANCAGVPLSFEVSAGRHDRTATSTRIPKQVKETVAESYGRGQTPLAVYYTIDRAGLRLPRSLPTQLPTGRHYANHGGLSNRMVDYRDFMARYRIWHREDSEAQTWSKLEHGAALEAFNTALGNFLDGFSDVHVRMKPLQLTVSKKSHQLALGQLSDGERAFIAVLGDLVRRLSLANPGLEDPLQGRGVVLIDELELHLHPTWQREVADKLRETFPNIQFIATTHSPFIIQSLRPGELINLDPDEFGDYADKSIEDIAENVMGVDVPQKSERYLQMMRVAEEYFRLLQTSQGSPQVISELEAHLDALTMRFSDDPAFQALLKLERATRSRGGDAPDR
jgi:predicted ATP-binding protein involved in virulence